jgi:DNA-binding NtrC family response regulator
VRVTAATTRNWQQRPFRKDLYIVKVIRIQTPSLRDVPEAIPVLVNHFLPKYCKAMNTDLKQFTPEALACVENTTGPETREQLENDLKRLVASVPGKT